MNHREHHVAIRASEGWKRFSLREIWRYRELLYFLVWRDIKIRYKQTALGAVWAVIQPLFLAIVASIFLGRLAGVSSDGLPYPLFAFCGLLPWQLFSHALVQSSASLVANERLISKIYFPRILIPLSAALGGIVDFAIATPVLAGMMFYYGLTPGWRIVWVPAIVLFALVTALSAGCWLSALNVRYRDVRYALPYLGQLWLFATPVVYPSSIVPEEWHALYGLNPMAGVVEAFRWAILGSVARFGSILIVSIVTVLAVLVSGLYYFRRVEESFADLI